MQGKLWGLLTTRSIKAHSKVKNIAFTETVYNLWLQRNAKVFNNNLDHCSTVGSQMHRGDETSFYLAEAGKFR